VAFAILNIVYAILFLGLLLVFLFKKGKFINVAAGFGVVLLGVLMGLPVILEILLGGFVLLTSFRYVKSSSGARA
jgi:hypothetical protein